jgi:hypothetical protein
VITLSGGTLNLTKNLTIQGPGGGQITVIGTYPYGAFLVDAAATVALSGLSINNGSGTGSGGGITNNGRVTVSGCTLAGNRVLFNGGAIFNNGGTLSVSNSIFSNNSARFGGGIYNAAGGTVTISNSTLSGNYAFHADYPWAGGDGGGIYNEGGATVTLSNTTVTGNTCDVNGAGIFNAAGGTVTLRNASSVTGNITTSYYRPTATEDVLNLGALDADSTSTIGTVSSVLTRSALRMKPATTSRPVRLEPLEGRLCAGLRQRRVLIEPPGGGRDIRRFTYSRRKV